MCPPRSEVDTGPAAVLMEAPSAGTTGASEADAEATVTDADIDDKVDATAVELQPAETTPGSAHPATRSASPQALPLARNGR